MSLLRLILAELRGSRGSALLFVLVVGVASACAAALRQLSLAAQDETRLVQRDIGLNVVLLPVDANAGDYWLGLETPASLRNADLAQLESQAVANRLVPMLKRRALCQAGEAQAEVWLVGIGSEIFAGGRKRKAVFGRAVEPGDLVFGARAAEQLGLVEGGTVNLSEQSFRVARILAEAGSAQDVSAFGDLETVQNLLGIPGQLSEIQALECHCEVGVLDPLEALREELAQVIPGVQVLRRRAAADARRSARLAAARVAQLATPLALISGGLLIALLALLNVRRRRAEIAAWNAIGMGRPSLLGLVLGRAALLGALGGGLGVLLASVGAPRLAQELFPLSGLGRGMLTVPFGFGWGMLLAAGAAAGACALPVALGLVRDPAEDLRHG
ncbi:MAG: ABC-type lipoprotein release transport system permease subunit [Planctomycetota bacterium]|jgi:ABC-type lipoprotein release transport system permease subunit